MRIAMVSPLFESVPPAMYGGTERVVHFLTEELVRMGHDVTLFASGDSVTSARLVAPCERATRLAGVRDHIASHVLQLEMVFQRMDQFDMVHFHTDSMHLPLSRRFAATNLATLHGRLDLPELGPLYREFFDAPVVSISDDQRRPLPFANWVGTVYHGIPLDLFSFVPRAEPYLAFVGRVSPEKRLDLAIHIAQAAGLEIRIAAKVDGSDREYFERRVRPLLGLPGVRFLGEVSDREKQELVGRALALLFPIDWPEPFGLVMIESMACGTPVIAWRRGSVPEVVDHGRTGLIVDTFEGAVRAVHAAHRMDRAVVRGWFEARFSARRMAEDYVRLYGRLAGVTDDRGDHGVTHGRSRLD